MKKTATIAYVVSFALSILLFFYVSAFFELDISRKNVDEGYGIITGYRYEKLVNGSAPCGVQERYSFPLSRVEDSYRELVFYTIHQNVEVYVGDECVYRMNPNKGSAFGKTPGCVWNRVRFDSDDANDTILVVIYPVYKSSVGVAPVFYYGNLFDITRKVFFDGLFVILLCLVGIVAGVIMMVYTLYNYKNSELDKSLLMLGCFSLVVSLWKLTDAQVIKFVFPGIPSLYVVPFLALQLMSIPFIMFIKELFVSRDKKIWYIPMFYSLAVLAANLFMQISGIRDLRQNLLLIHSGIVLTVLTGIGMVIYEIYTAGWNDKLRRNVVFLAICILGAATDMVIYYVSRGTKSTPLGMLGLIIYILAAGVFSLQDSKELMIIGMEARNFERMAYHDQLTGLYNRTAYAEYTQQDSFSPEQCIVAVFDLNNLKKCNDTLGHEKGDLYIKECADMINQTFNDIGKCYRMGGDEFTVLIEHSSVNICKQRMKRLQDLVKERNKDNPDIQMGIAYGYERYDGRMDYDINDTSKRADKKMYAEKIAMKQAQESQS